MLVEIWVVECQNQRSSILCTSAVGCIEHVLAKKVGKNCWWSLGHENGKSVPSMSEEGSECVERSMKRESRRGMTINRRIAWEWDEAR